jgi:hypothetical protein
LACVLFAWTALAAPPPSFSRIPNYMTPDQCDPFSAAATAFLHTKGIPAHRIIYGWSQYGGARGYHAAVLFKWEGRLYYMDNQRTRACRVDGKTDLGCVNCVAGAFGRFLWMTKEENSDRRAPRKIADLFAPNPEWMKSIQVGAQ